MKWNDAKKIIESNLDVKRELKLNQAEYEIKREIIATRKKHNLK